MELTEVVSSKLNKAFHKLPELIYRSDSNYIPHIRQDIDKIFDPKRNKLFKQGGEAIRWILKDEDEKVIGRVAAFINPKTKNDSKDGRMMGGMGFFECIDDQAAANVLFEACIEWLKERKVEIMDGPINFGERNEFWGLLIENFESPSAYQMNYNPAYYRKLFEAFGFKLYFKQVVFWRDTSENLGDKYEDAFKKISSDPDYKFATIQGIDLDQVAKDFQEVYNGAWASHIGYKKLKLEVAMNIMKALKPIIDRDIVSFVYYKERPIAFHISIPELNEIFKYVNGNLNWWGKLQFLYRKWIHPPKTMTGIVFGVVKDHQGIGVDSAFVKWSYANIKSLKRYTESTFIWIGDFNPKMIKVAQNLGGKEWRKLATYRYNFDRSIPFERHPDIG